MSSKGNFLGNAVSDHFL